MSLLKNKYLGEVVRFVPPSKKADLVGRVVNVQTAYEAYGNKTNYERNKKIYTIRVMSTIKLYDDSFRIPSVYKIPKENIKNTSSIRKTKS